jgi:membrane protease subunit HflC
MMSKIPIPTVVTGFVLVVILVLYMVSYQVRFAEAAIVKRFGKADDASVVREPGWRMKWPPPVETVEKFDLRRRTLDTPETEVKTGDGQALIVGAYIVWKIDNPLEFSVRVGTVRKAEEQLRTRVSEARATVFGRTAMGDLFNLDRELVQGSFDKLEGEMLAAVADAVKRDYGVQIEHIGIRRVALPSEATATVQEAMKKERENQATDFRERGAALKAAIEARAFSQKDQILAFADRRAQEIVSEGVRASERIFRQIRETDSEFFIWLRWLESIEASLKERTTIFIPSGGEIFRNFQSPRGLEPEKAAGALAPGLSAPPPVAETNE